MLGRRLLLLLLLWLLFASGLFLRGTLPLERGRGGGLRGRNRRSNSGRP
jgi:hypothetical protein